VIRSLYLLLLFALPLSADDAKDDLKRLAGSWVVEKAEKNGKPVKLPSVGATFTFSEDGKASMATPKGGPGGLLSLGSDGTAKTFAIRARGGPRWRRSTNTTATP
jgi:uncharacterized protein (TIGR03067 family)